MPKRRRFPRARRTVTRYVRRGGRRVRHTGGKLLHGGFGQALRGGGVLLAIDKLKQMFGIQIGTQRMDDAVDMIIAGVVDKKSHYFVPAGSALLVKELADGFIFGGGNPLGNLLGGIHLGGMAGQSAGRYAGD